MGALLEEDSIAIVGMAGRFPGAATVPALWELLKNGRESLSTLDDATLRRAGVGEQLLRQPNYVKALMRLDGIEHFDAGFFGYSPRQAASIDPQHRLLLECGWEALEQAGCDVRRYAGRVGVFAGCGINTYLLTNLGRLQRLQEGGWYETLVDSDKDFLATRLSYKLGLEGPSLSIQTACSSSLVAIHIACQSLANYECDMALAGGVSIRALQDVGYLYEEGGVLSADGHCRAFDAHATGMVGGSGAGIVVLKRLGDARREHHEICAVVRGSAINNDGSKKVGYTAPAASAQSELIATALAVSGVEPADIDFIEAHGTGTVLGDAIELTALTEVFAGRGNPRQKCALGSIKTNIGHLDAAAGVAGLIKSVLCLQNGALVPTLNFREPNAVIGGPASPFYVNTDYKDWMSAPGRARLAAVSSFGMGGTNAHVILEEAPQRSSEYELESEPEREQLVVVSARTQTAMHRLGSSLAAALETTRDIELADLAYSLQVGRRRFAYRRCIVAADREELISQLRDTGHTLEADERADRPILFLFPGQGAQRSGAVAGLYASDAVFRHALNECAGLLQGELDIDVRALICRREETASARINDTLYAQAALFAVEYSLTQLWDSWGVRPAAVIGHSLGEYAAACVAGAYSLPDAVKLVCARARLMERLPRGAMIAVQLDEHEARRLLTPQLSIAAVNTPTQCVVSGPPASVEQLAELLKLRNVAYHRLAVSHAFHSHMVEGAAEGLIEAASSLKVAELRIPYLSCTPARRVTARDIAERDYWATHLRAAVQFSRTLAEATCNGSHILLEVGPGQALINLARQQLPRDNGHVFVESLPDRGESDRRTLLSCLGRLWAHGASIDWERWHEGRVGRRRIALPTYPFERERHWMDVEPPTGVAVNIVRAPAARLPADQWFYVPSWRPSPVSPRPWSESLSAAASFTWLVLLDQAGVANALAALLRKTGAEVITVECGHGERRHDGDQRYLDVDEPLRYQEVIEGLPAGVAPLKVIHCPSLARWGAGAQVENAGQLGRAWHLSVLYLARALASSRGIARAELYVVTNNVYRVAGQGRCEVEKAAIPALCKVIGQECERVRCSVIDLPQDEERLSLRGQYEPYLAPLAADLVEGRVSGSVAYRGPHRLVEAYEQVQLTRAEQVDVPFRHRGVYLLAGGMGNVGMLLAEQLAGQFQARVALVTRGDFPPRARWPACREDESAVGATVRRLLAMESGGGQILVMKADVTQQSQLNAAIAAIEQRFGTLDGVFHLAADTRHRSAATPMAELAGEDFAVQMSSKVQGFHALDGALRDRALNFRILFSSNASILGGIGFGAYAAANAVLDHIAENQSAQVDGRWVAINWDAWIAGGKPVVNAPIESADVDANALSAAEAWDALSRIVARARLPRVVVSATDLNQRVITWVRGGARHLGRDPQSAPTMRVSAAQAPATPIEKSIAAVWEEALGVCNVSVDGKFLELGGDSLIGLRVVARLSDLYGVKIPMRTLMGPEPTIRRLAVEVVSMLAGLQDAASVLDELSAIERQGD